jgi:hypothetical protein
MVSLASLGRSFYRLRSTALLLAELLLQPAPLPVMTRVEAQRRRVAMGGNSWPRVQ